MQPGFFVPTQFPAMDLGRARCPGMLANFWQSIDLVRTTFRLTRTERLF